MADLAITFGSASIFGTIAGWNAQGKSSAIQQQRSSALDELGNVVASSLHTDITEVSQPFMCNNDTNTIPADIGALMNSAWILTGINISTSNTSYAQMTLSGHNHTNATHAASPALNKVAHTIAVSKAFGCTDFLGGTAGAAAAPVSSSCNITCSHQDEYDEDGDHIVGDNYNCQIQAETTWVGVPSVTAAAGWDVTSVTTTDENTGFVKTVVTGTKNLVMA